MVQLPDNYKWLQAEPGPRMIVEALKLYGTMEIVGAHHNPLIMGWAKELGIARIYLNDEMPWCGLAHAIAAKRAGKELPLTGYNILRALRYVAFGKSVVTPMLGDTLIFQREGGGHVGIYVGEDDKAYHVLGGNQGNAHSIARMAKDRLYAARRPHYNNQPVNVRRIYLAATGNLSTNES